jgi:uncharacterized protein YcsI (UPF0317 family)
MIAKTPAQLARESIRKREHTSHTANLAPGYVQANLVILPNSIAEDFLIFCRKNPKPCPLLAVLPAGVTEIQSLAPGSDIRTDLPAYRIWKKGTLIEELGDLNKIWNADLVSFLIGCSFSFDNLLSGAQIPVRHKDSGRNVPMFRTNIPCVPWGPFQGNMVVSMRPIHPRYSDSVKEISGKLPLCHGDPVHWGKPEDIGINDIKSPDFGESVNFFSEEEPVFWACGVTPQVVLEQANLDFAITHKPGHMFISDLKDYQLFEKFDLLG